MVSRGRRKGAAVLSSAGRTPATVFREGMGVMGITLQQAELIAEAYDRWLGQTDYTSPAGIHEAVNGVLAVCDRLAEQDYSNGWMDGYESAVRAQPEAERAAEPLYDAVYKTVLRILRDDSPDAGKTPSMRACAIALELSRTLGPTEREKEPEAALQLSREATQSAVDTWNEKEAELAELRKRVEPSEAAGAQKPEKSDWMGTSAVALRKLAQVVSYAQAAIDDGETCKPDVVLYYASSVFGDPDELFEHAWQSIEPEPARDVLEPIEREEVEACRRMAKRDERPPVIGLLTIVDRLAPIPVPVSPLEALLAKTQAARSYILNRLGGLPGHGDVKARLDELEADFAAIAAEKAGTK